MKHIKTIIVYFLILLSIECKNEKKEVSEKLSTEKIIKIDTYLKAELSNTLGLAVAVIKNKKLIYKNYLGKENLKNKKVNGKTIFPLYSISKLITSVGVFQLIEENKIHLDDNISLYIDGLPKEWKNIQVKNLLTHSSGLPDYNIIEGKISDSITLENLFKEKLHFKQGEHWEYNQTNFWFLTKIIEKVTNQSFESFIINNQFSNKKNNILYSSNFIKPIPNRSFKYSFNDSTDNWEKINYNFGKRANSAGGLNFTLNQFIEWNKNFDNNNFIQPDTKHKMWTPFKYKTPFYFENKKDKFLYGWQQYSTNNETSYGFTGGVVTGYRKFINQNLTIIVLTNGLKDTPIHNKIINTIAGIIDENLEFYQKKSIRKAIIGKVKKDVNEGISYYYELKKTKTEVYNFSNERELNTIGYELLRSGKTDDAIEIFKLLVSEFPESSNPYDSIGEGYYKKGLYIESLKNYKKSLALNPNSLNAKKMILKIEKLTN